jgi:hypothetical protein
MITQLFCLWDPLKSKIKYNWTKIFTHHYKKISHRFLNHQIVVCMRTLIEDK